MAGKTVSLEDYKELVSERPRKFTAEEVGYRPAGASAFRCYGCIHYFQRILDGLSTCEIFRSEETDNYGVDPTYQCMFWSQDGDQMPFVEEE